MYYSMTDGTIIMAAEPKGAELLSICDMTQKNKEYVWTGDEKYWKSHAPNLFPFVGRILGGKYTYDGKDYELKSRHGFARDKKFSLVAHTETSMTFSLRSDNETKAVYPFDFEFLVRYDLLKNKTVGVTYTVRNVSETEKMIFALGSHPGFRVPLNEDEKFEDYFLEFSEPCAPQRYLLTEEGFLTGETEPFELEDRVRLGLRHDLFDNDAIVLKNTAKTVTLKSRKGNNGLRMRFDGFNLLGIWHTNRSDAPFVCLEPWIGHSAFIDEKLPLEEKRDMISLEPRKEFIVGFQIQIF